MVTVYVQLKVILADGMISKVVFKFNFSKKFRKIAQ